MPDTPRIRKVDATHGVVTFQRNAEDTSVTFIAAALVSVTTFVNEAVDCGCPLGHAKAFLDAIKSNLLNAAMKAGCSMEEFNAILERMSGESDAIATLMRHETKEGEES